MGNAIKEFLIDNPKRYWVEEPADAAYEAYHAARQKYGESGEWSKADAAKHMTWQSEIAKRTMLPHGLAVPVANILGAGKELVADGVGSIGQYLMGTGGNPVPTMKNSLMDIWNNYVGASRNVTGPEAVELAGRSTNSIREALFNRLPYSDYQQSPDRR